MKKGIVLFFSLSGNNKRLAKKDSEEKNYDLVELLPGNFLRILTMGYRKGLKKEIDKLDLEKYSEIIIHGPIWASSPAPILLELLNSTKIKGKKIALILTHMGGNVNTEKIVNELVKSNDLKINSFEMINLNQK